MDTDDGIGQLANAMVSTLDQLQTTNDVLARFAMEGQANRIVLVRLMQEIARLAPDPAARLQEMAADVRETAREASASVGGQAEIVVAAVDAICRECEASLRA